MGHRWVKRLFIDKRYKTGADDPEENEDPADYTMIFATVEDNVHLLRASPSYLKSLAAMPEDLRRAYRYGDWDALGGGYFKEFGPATHAVKPFRPPEHWPRYRSFDYGLDMFACLWWAVDEDGRAWCVREFERKGLIVQQAAARLLENTLPYERVEATYAPPDMWSRQKDTGRTMAELFALGGVPLVKSGNSRVQGHMLVKEMLAPLPLTDPFVKSLWPEGQAPAALPGLMFFEGCKTVMGDLRDIQADELNPNDCAKQPHEVTHTVDAVRYFCVSRSLSAERPAEAETEEEEEGEDYEAYMTGGAYTEAWMD